MIVGDLMITIAALIVKNEFCQEVKDAGALDFIFNIMVDYPDSEKLNWQALKLLKALAGNDNVKFDIVTSGCGPLVVSAISRLKVNFLLNSLKFAKLFFSFSLFYYHCLN